jgi:hypothetical protein
MRGGDYGGDTMTVKDLIKKLQAMPDENAEVLYEYYGFMEQPVASVFARRGEVILRDVTVRQIREHKGIWR